jgi:hypothetical protein
MCLRKAYWIFLDAQGRNRINSLSHRVAEGVFDSALAVTANIIGIFTCFIFSIYVRWPGRQKSYQSNRLALKAHFRRKVLQHYMR